MARGWLGRPAENVKTLDRKYSGTAGEVAGVARAKVEKQALVSIMKYIKISKLDSNAYVNYRTGMAGSDRELAWIAP